MADAGELIGKSAVCKHLLVLVHGFWGSPKHLDHLQDVLTTTHADAGIKVLMPASNRENNTYDGIEVGAERITHEILQIVEDLRKEGHKPEKFSIVGYSLGGLIARYVVGLLYSDKFFDDIEPTNFTTFATPHLGVRSPKLGYQVDAWNWLGSNTLSVSGQQLYLIDNFRDTGRPLLDILADPASTFVRGLQLFSKKTIYANVQNDPAVPYYTASFSKTDPFMNIDKVDLKYLTIPGETLDVILDPAEPVTPKQELQRQDSWLSSFTMSEKTRQSLPFYALATAVLPLAVPVLLTNAAYQTFQSSARVKAHETGSAVDLQRYRLPIFEESQKLQDKVVEGMTNTTGEDYLPTPPPEQAERSEHDGAKEDWPTLALLPPQFTMIDHLDALGFTKYLCYIKIRRAHACIVVRAKNSSFEEGKVVCRHWANSFVV